MNIPVITRTELKAKLDRREPVVLLEAPAIAAGVLSSMGYGNVRVFPGGKQEWEEAGLRFDAQG